MLFQSNPEAKPDTFKSIPVSGVHYITPLTRSRMNARNGLIDAVQMNGLPAGAIDLYSFHSVSLAIKSDGWLTF